MIEYIVHSGEEKELVYANEPKLDVRFVQEEGSKLKLTIYRWDCNTDKDKIEVEHIGEGCETEIDGVYVLKNGNRSGLQTRMLHTKGKGKSRQMIKFVLGGDAQGEFFGIMKIAKDAQQVEAEQTNKNLLLNEKATMRTRPQLEIYADDVKASHGATTGQLDEKALFYMQQRGISVEEGRKMLIKAFVDIKLNSDDEQEIAQSPILQGLASAIDSII